MEFDEIVVKESPGLCRCCLSEGCYKDMGTEYTWMNENEVYADMLLECFDIGISQHNEGPNGPNRLICEVCITRLRDACNFKKQVLDSEKKFVDMVGRGEYKHKVLIYQTQMKAEASEEMEDTEVEYLEEDIADYVDEEEAPPPPPPAPPSSSAGAGRPRGRPRKAAPDNKRKLDERPKTSKAVVKGLKEKRDQQESRWQRLSKVRSNILAVLRYGNVTPFKWHTKGFSCFYCAKPMRDCTAVKEHCLSKHATLDTFDPKIIVSKDVPVKIDVGEIACKLCPDVEVRTCDELVAHIIMIHEEEYFYEAGVCLLPFVLDKDLMNCVLCEKSFDNFTSIMMHMNKEHVAHSHICQICGVSFVNMIRLNRHINSRHLGCRCTICNKRFLGNHTLERHKARFHGQLKIHECSLCSASFENNYLMKVHMGKVHNVEKYRIQCDQCPKVCTTKGAMVLHMQAVHSDVRYECDLCEYKTAVKWLIKLHKRKHFGEKPYNCSICSRKFGRSSNLRTHMKVHTGQMGRVCRWCRQGFADGESFEQHKAEIHAFDQM